jgi:hypothetical protein
MRVAAACVVAAEGVVAMVRALIVGGVDGLLAVV